MYGILKIEGTNEDLNNIFNENQSEESLLSFNRLIKVYNDIDDLGHYIHVVMNESMNEVVNERNVTFSGEECIEDEDAEEDFNVMNEDVEDVDPMTVWGTTDEPNVLDVEINDGILIYVIETEYIPKQWLQQFIEKYSENVNIQYESEDYTISTLEGEMDDTMYVKKENNYDSEELSTE